MTLHDFLEIAQADAMQGKGRQLQEQGPNESSRAALQSLRQGMGVFWNADASPCHFSPRKGAKLSDLLTQPF